MTSVCGLQGEEKVSGPSLSQGGSLQQGTPTPPHPLTTPCFHSPSLQRQTEAYRGCQDEQNYKIWLSLSSHASSLSSTCELRERGLQTLKYPQSPKSVTEWRGDFCSSTGPDSRGGRDLALDLSMGGGVSCPGELLSLKWSVLSVPSPPLSSSGAVLMACRWGAQRLLRAPGLPTQLGERATCSRAPTVPFWGREQDTTVCAVTL